MHLLIGTPTYNDQVTVGYMRSVLGVLQALDAPADWTPIRSTLIAQARNWFASRMLDGPFSHVLFVDADLEFAPSAVLRMLAFDKPVVACAYPLRGVDPARVHWAARAVEDPRVAWESALEYPLELEEPVVAQGGFFRARHAPAGLMLIKREVFERLRDAHPDLHVSTDRSAYSDLPRVLQVFDSLRNAAGVTLGEDVSFCRRWTDIGGEIWTLLDERVGHTGPFTFTGRAAQPPG